MHEDRRGGRRGSGDSPASCGWSRRATAHVRRGRSSSRLAREVGKVRMHVRAGFDRALLAEVLEVLREEAAS